MQNILTSKHTTELNKSIELFLNDHGTSLDYFNSLVMYEANKNDDIREGIRNAALMLTLHLEETYQIKFPYFLGGGHGIIYDASTKNYLYNEFINDKNILGVNPYVGNKLTLYEKMKYKHSDGTIYHKYGYDCSSIIMLIYKFAGLKEFSRASQGMAFGKLDLEKDAFQFPLGKVYTMGNVNLKNSNELLSSYYSKYDSDTYIGQIGDIVYTKGHVMLIIDIDHANGILYTVEEKSGYYGLVRTYYNINDLISSDKYAIINVDEYINNQEKVLSTYYYSEFKNNENLIVHKEYQRIKR